MKTLVYHQNGTSQEFKELFPQIKNFITFTTGDIYARRVLVNMDKMGDMRDFINSIPYIPYSKYIFYTEKSFFKFSYFVRNNKELSYSLTRIEDIKKYITKK